MSELIVPPLERDEDLLWPSLGSAVADWQEATLAFGPGDLLGRPYRADAEDRAILERAYQVYPPQHTGRCSFDADGDGWRCTVGNGRCGRRRFDTVVLMKRKGTKKSEGLAATAAAEMGDDAPVRCDGFRRQGKRWVPVGRPVVSPSVWILAFAKEQAEDTSFDAMKAMIERGPGASKFTVWEDRILRRDGTGEAKALATAPDSRDGGKTTFQGLEESHRWTLPRQHEAYSTTHGNLSKRPNAQPWEMHATTMYAPGEGSVAEELHDGARALSGDAAKRSRMFFFYRWADEKIQIRDADGSWNEDGLRRAVIDASGPVVAKWSDIDDIVSRQFLAPGADPNYAERVWLNRGQRGTAQAFDIDRWKAAAKPNRVPDGALVVMGWHGARYWDAAALVATEIATGFTWPVGIWQRPPDRKDDWEVPEDEVDVAVANAFDRLTVWKFYVNPDRWESSAANWARIYGEDRVVAWRTNAWTHMSRAVRAFDEAIRTGSLTHSGNAAMTAHIGASRRRQLSIQDDDGKQVWVPVKERPDSPFPINAALAAVIAWQARLDALKSGATAEQEVWSAV